MINLYRDPLEGVYFMINSSIKKFYTKNKDIRGKEVSLSYSSERLETRSVTPIE